MAYHSSIKLAAALALTIGSTSLFGITACKSNSYSDNAGVSNGLTVSVSGTGTNEDEALRQALKNAVMQAVGTIVDAETILKNDDIIKDQVLTASSAIVTKVERIGVPHTDNGLTTVSIRASVEKKLLFTKLRDAKVVAERKVDGESMWAQLTSEMASEKDTGKVVERILEGTSTQFVKVGIEGAPTPIGEKDGKILLRTKIRVAFDEKKYDEWCKNAEPLLSKLSTNFNSCWTYNSPDSNSDNRNWNGLSKVLAESKSPLSIAILHTYRTKIYHLSLSSGSCRALVLASAQQPMIKVNFLDSSGNDLTDSSEIPFIVDGRLSVRSAGCFSNMFGFTEFTGIQEKGEIETKFGDYIKSWDSSESKERGINGNMHLGCMFIVGRNMEWSSAGNPPTIADDSDMFHPEDSFLVQYDCLIEEGKLRLLKKATVVLRSRSPAICNEPQISSLPQNMTHIEKRR